MFLRIAFPLQGATVTATCERYSSEGQKSSTTRERPALRELGRAFVFHKIRFISGIVTFGDVPVVKPDNQTFETTLSS